jgi:predicted nuclease with TOPRIM domain
MLEGNMADNQEHTKQTPWHWEWVKSISILAIVAVGCYKLFETNLNITVDFPTLLSLLLGFFSVWLASLFYFKATDSSNAFYDNTHKFTATTSQLLAKIEAGFGERLKTIEGHNQEMRDFVVKDKHKIVEEMEETEGEVKETEGKIGKINEEKDKLIEELTKRAGMSEEEVSNFKTMLSEKNKELDKFGQRIRSYESKIESLSEALNNSPVKTYSNKSVSLKESLKRLKYNKQLELIDEINIEDKKHFTHLQDDAINIVKSYVSLDKFIEDITNNNIRSSTLSLLLTVDLIPRKYVFIDKYIPKLKQIMGESQT